MPSLSPASLVKLSPSVPGPLSLVSFFNEVPVPLPGQSRTVNNSAKEQGSVQLQRAEHL